MDIRFDNKVAFVTGAAGGIGFAAAKMFAEAGAKVAMADMNMMYCQSHSMFQTNNR